MPPIRVLLVHDLVMVTDALAMRLSALPDMVLVGQFGVSDPQLVQATRVLSPDVAVVDVEAAGAGAAELVAAMRRGCLLGQVVVLTASRDRDMSVAVARAGAAAWVDQTSSLDHLIEVVRGVCHGWGWWSPFHLRAVLQALDAEVNVRGESALMESLSPREREVLDRIVVGKSHRVIASELLVSVNTVRTHTSKVFAKLGVHNRLEAVELAAAARPPAAGEREPSRADEGLHLMHRDDSLPRRNP
ncbi:MAG: response regulator transcription factor [Actinomycetota bacterium]|nr:response regulator transcription factor [Actinomycetota bacterium]